MCFVVLYSLHSLLLFTLLLAQYQHAYTCSRLVSSSEDMCQSYPLDLDIHFLCKYTIGLFKCPFNQESCLVVELDRLGSFSLLILSACCTRTAEMRHADVMHSSINFVGQSIAIGNKYKLLERTVNKNGFFLVFCFLFVTLENNKKDLQHWE